MMPNHHITKPVLIGEIQGDGQFDIVWQTRPGGRRRMVGLPAGLQGPDLRLAQAHELRQLQRCHGQVRRQGQVGPDVTQLTGRGDFESPVLISGLILSHAFLRLLAVLLSALASVLIAGTRLWPPICRPSWPTSPPAVSAIARRRWARWQPRAMRAPPPSCEALAAGQLYVRTVRQCSCSSASRTATSWRSPKRSPASRPAAAPKPTSTACGSTTACAASSRPPSARSP